MDKKSFTKLSIIIPIYNEEDTIQLSLDRIMDVTIIDGIEKELIVVNDGSSDNSEVIILQYLSDHPYASINYCKHERNLGKGAAIHTGIKKASGEYIVILDADLEYDPRELNHLIKPIVIGFADVVYGSRFVGGKPHRILFFWHTIGNKLITFLLNLSTNLNLTDVETCLKVFDARMIKSIALHEKRFGFEPEVTIKISRIPHIRIYEVGISYYGRTYEDGKKIRWRDGINAILCIIRYGILHRK